MFLSCRGGMRQSGKALSDQFQKFGVYGDNHLREVL